MNHKIDVVAGRYYINLFPKEQKKKKKNSNGSSYGYGYYVRQTKF